MRCYKCDCKMEDKGVYKTKAGITVHEHECDCGCGVYTKVDDEDVD